MNSPIESHDVDAEGENEPEGRVLSVHVGHSANCSSIGSVIDFLFVSGIVASSTIAAMSVLVGAARVSHDEAPAAKREDPIETPEASDDET